MISNPIRESKVSCEKCGKPLCNICGFNRACEQCGAAISDEVDDRLREDLSAGARL